VGSGLVKSLVWNRFKASGGVSFSRYSESKHERNDSLPEDCNSITVPSTWIPLAESYPFRMLLEFASLSSNWVASV